MEEKVVGGKEKKYVLYTVVGEERGRAGPGVWVVRVLLGTLLLVALAVVPYLSLRLAQANDRTLLVLQPMPIHNHSYHRHHDRHHSDGVIQYGKIDHIIGLPMSAALSKDNATAANQTTAPANASVPANATAVNATSSSAGSIVTLHESAVTLAVMEDTNATRRKTAANDTEEEAPAEEESGAKVVEEDKTEPEEAVTTEDSASTAETPAALGQVATVTDHDSPSTPPPPAENTTHAAQTSPAPHQDANVSTAAPAAASTAAAAAAADAAVSPSASSTPQTSANTTTKPPAAKAVNATTTTTTTAAPTTTKSTTTTRAPTTTNTPSPHRALAHKLVYMSTSASGNHVGGFCVWKTDKNVTRWAFLYENIPIEYQSHQDSSDHEMRGMLAAVRTWAPLWNDHHVVLRSHHPVIKGSDHPTRRALSRELEQLSEGRFTYELEWRFRKTDRVVDIAYCLSRLHRDFSHWFRTFEGRVDELLGPQDWTKANVQERTSVSQEAFTTNYEEEDMTRNEK